MMTSNVRGFRTGRLQTCRTVTYHGPTEREQCFEQGIQRLNRILFTILTLQPSSVETNIPIRELVDKVKEPRNDGVQPVCSHFDSHKLDERLATRKDPAVHDVL